MDKEQMIETNDDSEDDGILSMARDFYNRKMLSVVIIFWVWAIIFIAGAVYSGSKFFDAGEVKQQIIYASIFICCFQGICLIKILAWQMISRNNINRKIKKLGLSISEFNQTVENR